MNVSKESKTVLTTPEVNALLDAIDVALQHNIPEAVVLQEWHETFSSIVEAEEKHIIIFLP